MSGLSKYWVLATAAFLAISCVVAGAPVHSAVAAPVTKESPEGPPVELYFEIKLLMRTGPITRRVVVDQWAGGRLLMRAVPVDEAADAAGLLLELVRPLENPWTFRWYDMKDEIKLGAAVSVPEPEGDPYQVLRELLEPVARQKYERWWGDDLVERTAPESPRWAGAADRFWAERHREERRRKDPLHSAPVYPFHVLGDPSARFNVTVLADGRVLETSIADRMSEPWLPRGWTDWRAGFRRVGYGYWAATPRPDWEPRTYQALAAALTLLSWPVLEPGAGDRYRLATGDGGPGFTRCVSRVVETLQPRARGRLDWDDSPEAAFTVVERSAARTVVVGTTGPFEMRNAPAIVSRVWRYARFDHGLDRVEQDELQVLVEHRDRKKIKLWIKIGYRPYRGDP